MKRTKSRIPPGDKPLWRNRSGTYTTPDGTRVGPGGLFRANEDEIPDVFMDALIPVDHTPSRDGQPPALYELQKVGVGWYDIVDEQGKTINEKRLRKNDALELLKSLTG